MKTVAVIPARGGSKGIPRKNLIELGGLPLVAWSILRAKQIKNIDAVYVSTDDLEIKEVALKFGAEVPYLRPKRYATDEATIVDAVADLIHFLDKKDEAPDVVVLLQPTQPFRSIETVTKALELFKQKRNNGVVGVSLAEESPILMRYLDTDTGALTNFLSGVNSTVRRQDMPLIYKVNGVIYVNSAADYLSGRSLNDNPYALITPKAEAVDIDEKDDLLFAEYMVKKGMVSLP